MPIEDDLEEIFLAGGVSSEAVFLNPHHCAQIEWVFVVF